MCVNGFWVGIYRRDVLLQSSFHDSSWWAKVQATVNNHTTEKELQNDPNFFSTFIMGNEILFGGSKTPSPECAEEKNCGVLAIGSSPRQRSSTRCFECSSLFGISRVNCNSLHVIFTWSGTLRLRLVPENEKEPQIKKTSTNIYTEQYNNYCFAAWNKFQLVSIM